MILIRERVIEKAAGGAYIFTVVFWLVQILTVVNHKYAVYEVMALGQYRVENYTNAIRTYYIALPSELFVFLRADSDSSIQTVNVHRFLSGSIVNSMDLVCSLKDTQ